MRFWRLLILVSLILSMGGCAAPQTEPPVILSPVPPLGTPTDTATLPPVPAVSLSTPTDQLLLPTSTNTELPNKAATALPPTPTFDPAAWKELPVIPTLSPRALEILQDGLAKGNNPRAFSKVGDCESQSTWFLGNYDLGEEHYALGPYETELRPVIGYYTGSFNRTSLAARQGFTSASLFAPLWASRETCAKNEGPLSCEYRLHRPIVAFVMLGTNDAANPKTFEGHMRKIIEYSISQGVLPILGTKADNIEKDHAINATIARLGMEYDVPVWNFWAGIQGLPHWGLQNDGVHLTYANMRFDKASNMKKAWPVRNLNALQILKIVMEQTEGR